MRRTYSSNLVIKNMVDAKSLARKIMGVEITHENGELSDNIAVMLASFFEGSIYHPEDRTLDEFDCWTQWSVDQVDLIQNKIEQLIEEEYANFRRSN